MRTIFRKELADYFTSVRIVILLFLVLLTVVAALYFDYNTDLRTVDKEFIFLRLFTTQLEGIPQLFNFINIIAQFFIPIIGIALGFDAISGERSSGTISRILSQPVFRVLTVFRLKQRSGLKYWKGCTMKSIILQVCVTGIRQDQ